MSIVLDGNNISTVGVINSGTAQASTSGTSIDFTGIPAGVKRITVMFAGVSTSGSSNIMIQAGSGSVVATGYLSYGSYTYSSSGATSNTSGFLVDNANGASNFKHGNATLCLLGSNVWVCSSVTGNSGSNVTGVAGGSISLGGTLDRVRITTVNGTDTFDAGSINILYE